jgi:hypothetical protein
MNLLRWWYILMLRLQIRGRAIAQAVSRWLPTAATRVWSCGICGGQSGAVVGFLWVLRFPLPIRIPPLAAHSPSSIIWGLYNRPAVAAVPSGLSPTPLIIILIINNNKIVKSIIFCDAPCSLVQYYQYFEGMHFLYLQGRQLPFCLSSSLRGLLFDPVGEGSMFLRNVDVLSPYYMTLWPEYSSLDGDLCDDIRSHSLCVTFNEIHITLNRSTVWF